MAYESDTRRTLNSLRKAVESDLFDDDLKPVIESFESQIRDDKQTCLRRYRDEIVRMIESDIVLRHSYAAGAAEHNLIYDKDVKRAAELLTDRAEYDRLLAPGTEEIQN